MWTTCSRMADNGWSPRTIRPSWANASWASMGMWVELMRCLRSGRRTLEGVSDTPGPTPPHGAGSPPRPERLKHPHLMLNGRPLLPISATQTDDRREPGGRMGFYDDRVLPHVINLVMNNKQSRSGVGVRLASKRI